MSLTIEAKGSMEMLGHEMLLFPFIEGISMARGMSTS